MHIAEPPGVSQLTNATHAQKAEDEQRAFAASLLKEHEDHVRYDDELQRAQDHPEMPLSRPLHEQAYLHSLALEDLSSINLLVLCLSSVKAFAPQELQRCCATKRLQTAQAAHSL